MKSKLEKYKQELSELMETNNDPNTPSDIKDAISPAIDKLKSLIKEEEAKGDDDTASKKKAKPKGGLNKVRERLATQNKSSEKKTQSAKKSLTALDRCREIIAKYKEKKKADARRVQKRIKAGKPVELTPAETIKKAAVSVKAKVVEMDKGLKVSEETAIISGIVKSVVSAMAGIKDQHRKKQFLSKIIENLNKLNKTIKLRAEYGMHLEEGGYMEDADLEMDDDMAETIRRNIVSVRHHTDDILSNLKQGSELENWMVNRTARAATDLADVAHFLDGSVNKMASGGYMAKGGEIDSLYTKLVEEHSKGGYEKMGVGFDRFLKSKMDSALEKDNMEMYHKLMQVEKIYEDDFYADGGMNKISLKDAFRDFISSGTIANWTGEEKYENLDEIRLRAMEIAPSSAEYSIEAAKEIANIAKKELEGGFMAHGGDVSDEAYAKTKAIQSINWDEELREYAGKNYSTLTQDEKDSIISDMQRDWYRNYSFKRGGYMAKGGAITDNYRESLENMSDQELAEEVENEMGISYDDVMQDIEDERDTYIDELVRNFQQNMMSRGEFAKGGEVEKEHIDASAKSIYDEKGMMALRNTFLQAAKADEDAGDEETAQYRRKVVSEYQSKQPKFMAKGGEIANMSEKEFINKYFGANVFTEDVSKYFDIKKISSSNDAKIDKFIEDHKNEGYTIKKKSYSDFKSVLAVKKKKASGGYMAKGGVVDEISFKNSNLYLKGFGKDISGNSIVKVSFPNERAFAIQTNEINGILNFTHDKRGYKLSELSSSDIDRIEREVVEYVKNYGSKSQKERLKTYRGYEDGGYMAKGGRTLAAIMKDRKYRSNEDWELKYKRKSNPKNPRYKKYEEGGINKEIKKYPLLNQSNIDIIN